MNSEVFFHDFVVIIAVLVTSGRFLRMLSSCRVSSRLLKHELGYQFLWFIISFFHASFSTSMINHFHSLDETKEVYNDKSVIDLLHLAFSWWFNHGILATCVWSGLWSQQKCWFEMGVTFPERKKSFQYAACPCYQRHGGATRDSRHIGIF